MAAKHLGWPVGSVKSRLAWARERLAFGLTRAGRPRQFPVRSTWIGDGSGGRPVSAKRASSHGRCNDPGRLERRSQRGCSRRDRIGRSDHAHGRRYPVHDECETDARGGRRPVRRSARRRRKRDEHFRIAAGRSRCRADRAEPSSRLPSRRADRRAPEAEGRPVPNEQHPRRIRAQWSYRPWCSIRRGSAFRGWM